MDHAFQSTTDSIYKFCNYACPGGLDKKPQSPENTVCALKAEVVMKKLWAALLFCGISLAPRAAPCAAQTGAVEDIIVYRLPDPERLYIYRSGMVVYDAKIPGNAIINNTFILPENVQLDSLTVSQSGKRIYTYSTEVVEALVVLRSGERPKLVRILQVHVPEIAGTVPLEVKYGIRNSGLTWDFALDMEIKELSGLRPSRGDKNRTGASRYNKIDSFKISRNNSRLFPEYTA
jgi:hypothetical protein